MAKAKPRTGAMANATINNKDKGQSKGKGIALQKAIISRIMRTIVITRGISTIRITIIIIIII